MRTSFLNELNMPEKHSRFIRNYYENIVNESYVDKIILFGSCAKGNVTIESDIDILIVTKTDLADDSEEIYFLLYKSTESIPLTDYVCCDIITTSIDNFHKKTTPLIRAILREGVELHGIL